MRAAREPQLTAVEPGAEGPRRPALELDPEINSIPICPIEEPAPEPISRRAASGPAVEARPTSANFQLPTTDLCNQPHAPTSHDEAERDDITARRKTKF